MLSTQFIKLHRFSVSSRLVSFVACWLFAMAPVIAADKNSTADKTPAAKETPAANETPAKDKQPDEKKATTQDNEPASASDEKPKVTKVAGVFQAVTAIEMTVDNEQFSSLEIKRLLPHGTSVKKGQNIVWFDTEQIDKTIKKNELERKLAKVNLMDEEFKLEQFFKTQALDKDAAQRARKIAQQKFDNYMSVDRERDVRVAQFNLKSSQMSLENAMEELKQLEQMYKEDDLTEESEEIVLKRTKQSVEFAEFRFDGTKISTERTIQQSIPRKDASEKEALERAELAFQKSMEELQRSRDRKEIEMAQKRDQFMEQQHKFEELLNERKRMVWQSPIDGIVLHGTLNRGKLAEKPSALKAGSKVSADQVVVTVVSPAKLQVRIDLDEKVVGLVKPTTKCKIVPRAYPETHLDGTVKSVSSVPYAGSRFDCVVTFKPNKSTPVLLPTMGCDIEFAADKETEKTKQKKKK